MGIFQISDSEMKLNLAKLLSRINDSGCSFNKNVPTMLKYCNVQAAIVTWHYKSGITVPIPHLLVDLSQNRITFLNEYENLKCLNGVFSIN